MQLRNLKIENYLLRLNVKGFCLSLCVTIYTQSKKFEAQVKLKIC